MENTYFDNLIKTVLDNSESSCWSDATQEWKVVGCNKDNDGKSKCVCGKKNLKYCYRIENICNGKSYIQLEIHA